MLYVAFGVAVPVLFLHGNHANANAQVGGNKLTASEKRGREIFAFRCGFCHTLAAANAIGKVGPNLDSLGRPKASCSTRSTTAACPTRVDEQLGVVPGPGGHAGRNHPGARRL